MPTEGRHRDELGLFTPQDQLEVLPAITPEPELVPARHAAVPRAVGRRSTVIVLVAALAVFGWRVGVPSPWRDETATMAACRRSIGQLFAMTQNIDRVHLGFYALTRLALAVHDSVTSARVVSVAAMALAAALLSALAGRLLADPVARPGDPLAERLVAPITALTAGAVFVAMPVVSRWAQDARPAALITLLATAATWWLVAASREPHRASLWVWYAGCVVALGFVNVLGLLLLPAHAVYLALTEPLRLMRRWATVTALTGVPLVPWLALTFGQRDQVAWIERPHLYDLTGVFVHAFGSQLVPAAVVLAALATLVVSRGLPGGGAGRAFVLGTVWAAGPPITLWVVSLVTPLWDAHYVIFALPGLALLVAAEVAVLTAAAPRRLRRLRRAGRQHGERGELADRGEPGDRPARGALATAVAGVLVVAVVGLVGLPDQRAYRDAATGHEEDSRGVVRYLRANALPGDGILFAPITLRNVRTTFPEGFDRLTDLALARTPLESATLYGENVTPEELAARLAGHPRIWLLGRDSGTLRRPGDLATVATLKTGFHEGGHVELPGFRITLYLADA